MMKNLEKLKKRSLAKAVALVVAGSTAIPLTGQAQESNETQAAPQIEEVVVMGRLRDAARSLVMERIEQPFAAEVVGIEQISRAGDSDVAMALRRVTGLTLVDGKYIYVRGLGERYSSATLNGAEIPSPELSRNVIPMDYIPASILESVKIHKAYSADQPAAFGGGNVDIRTKGTPTELVFNVSVGAGWNTENSGQGLTNLGDQGDMPASIMAAIDKYQGDIRPANITRFEYPSASTPNAEQIAEGERINKELMMTLNRDINIESERSLDPDRNASITAGNAFFVNDDITVGALANVSIGESSSNSDQFERDFSDPDGTFRNVQRTFTNESLTGALNLSIDYQERHNIATNSYVLQDDEDQSSLVLGFNPDFQQASGRQRKTNVSRMEKRELVVNQVIGSHEFERYDLDAIPYLPVPDFITSVSADWFYSLATASTDVPNASSVQSTNLLNPATNELLSSQVNIGSTAQFNFLSLEDEVESWGYKVDTNFDLGFTNGTVSGGYTYSEKSREYYGYTANIVTGAVGRLGDPWEVFGDDNLTDPDNDFFLNMGSNFGTESYIAGETKLAAFGSIDAYLTDSWRISGGVRWEDFSRGVLPLNLLDYEGDSLQSIMDQLQDPNQTLAVRNDDLYPSAALTYINDGFLNTDNFQVRLGYGRTVVRPDLREFADIQFIDPELNDRVQGNPSLKYSDVDHLDLRTELFYENGDNLTVSLFYKDITNPIERVERPGPQDARLLSFDNALSGEVYGIEFEGMKTLPAGFFVSGNLVVSDSELQFDASSSQTSLTRRLTGHSEYVVNTQLGYDSDNGMHSASLLYNVFGERVFFGGRNSAPDAFESPFHSLDLTYSFFPTDRITLRLRAQNILDENREFTQGDVDIIDVETGSRLRFDLQWNL